MSRTVDPENRAYYVVEIDSVRVMEFQEVSGIQNETEVVPYSQGGENEFETKLRGRNKYSNLVFKHGITLMSPAIWAWREATIHRKTPPMLTITVIMLNYAGDEITRWIFRECWPVKWAGPDFKAGESNLAIETLELTHSGFYVEIDEPEKRKRKKPAPVKPEPKKAPEPDPEPGPFKVAIDPAESEVEVGDSVRLKSVNVEGVAVKWKWLVEGQETLRREAVGRFMEKGDRKVTLEATDADDQTATATATVKVKLPPFEIAVAPQRVTLKRGEEQRFGGSAIKGGPIKTFEWTIEEKTVSDSDPTGKFDVAGERKVKLKATDEHGQTAEDEALVKVLIPPFRIDIDPEFKEINVGEKVKFKGVAKVGGPIKTYEWTIEGKKATEAEPEGEFKKPGERPIVLKATDEDGQEATAHAKVKVKDLCPDWKPQFTFIRDSKLWNTYIFELPDKGPNGENIAYIHWDFDKKQANIKTRFRKQQKKPKYAYQKSGDTYDVKVMIRLQGFEDCAWVMTCSITPDRAKDKDLKKKKSTKGEKWHYDGPNDKWYEKWGQPA